MSIPSLFGCPGPSEQLFGEFDGMRVYEREESDHHLCVESTLHLVRLAELEELPRLRVLVNAKHGLVRKLVMRADYRVEGDHKEYYIAVDGRFLLRRQKENYVVFEIPEIENVLAHTKCSSP